MSAQSNELSLIGQQVGKYTVVRQLGEGGMGVVYEAMRRDIGSRVALKVLRTEFAMNNEIANRFFNEARAANIVEHPSIVKVFDYGQLTSGAAYLAMEFLSGESLYSRLQRERRLSESDTIRIGRQVATALAAAHAKQVIHRDLKPENIMLVPDVETPSGERAKILDFGIAKLARQHTGGKRTDTSVVMGTPIYMSPEQCRGGKLVGDRADVYALGVMLFEMLTGRTPFVAEEAGEYIGMHLFKDPPPVGQLAPAVSLKLQRLIDTMLLKDPQQRPAMVLVAVALRDLSSHSSDVESLKAIAAESKLDLDTQPPIRLTSEGAVDMALGRTAPAGEGLANAAKVAGTGVSKGAAGELSPMRQTIDPLGDTLPGRSAPQPPKGATAEPPRSSESPSAASRPPEAAIPSGSTAAAGAGSASTNGAAASDSEVETLKPGQARSLPGREVARPGNGDQSGNVAALSARAQPPVTPASEAPTIKPGQLNRAQFQGDLAAAARESAVPWQPMHIRSGAHPALDGPTAKLGQDSLDALNPGRRSLATSWRRLRYQLRIGARNWLGISSLAPGEDATQTSRSLLPWFFGIAALLLGASALVVMLRAPASPQPPTRSAVSATAAIPTGAVTPDAPAKAMDQLSAAESTALAAAVVPTVPPTPAVPPPSPLQGELAEKLDAAQQKADAGKLAQALKAARAAAKKFGHAAAWAAVGRYACLQTNIQAANEAISHLAPAGDESTRYRSELISLCQKHGLQLGQGGQFVSAK